MGLSSRHPEQSLQRRFFRQKKLQHIHFIEVTGFQNTGQDQILLQRSLRVTAVGVTTILRESLNRVFRIVVVPWHTIVVEKREHLWPILDEALPVLVNELGIGLQ